MLKRITDPMEYARAEIAITANNENLPVALARIGTMTRKPLPKMEASGVAVARKSFALLICFSRLTSGAFSTNRLLYHLNLMQQLLNSEAYVQEK